MNNLIEKKIKNIEGDILRYKNYILKDLESNNLNKIESSLNGYSQEILGLIKTVEELKRLKELI